MKDPPAGLLPLLALASLRTLILSVSCCKPTLSRSALSSSVASSSSPPPPFNRSEAAAGAAAAAQGRARGGWLREGGGAGPRR